MLQVPTRLLNRPALLELIEILWLLRDATE
jgi:hypothetical protein